MKVGLTRFADRFALRSERQRGGKGNTKVFFVFLFFSRVPESIELRLTEREEAGGVFAGVIALKYHL